jgi:DNA-binding NarL/FixJ family response regulator
MSLPAHLDEPDPVHRRPIRLLLVDDSPKVLAALLWIFADDPDLRIVATALTAEEALEAARRTHPDLVLMDVRMPGMGGVAAVPYFKRQDPPPLVILLSLLDDQALFREARLAGADALLVKTELDGPRIVSIVDELLRT